MSRELWMFLDLNPEPWAVGPLQAVRRGGRLSAFMGRNQQLASYQEAVREAVRETWGDLPPLEGIMSLDCYFWRRRSEYNTPAERKHRKHEADATNLLKALEDALQGVLYKNDRDNAAVSSRIVEQGPEVEPGIVIRLRVIASRDVENEQVIGTMPAGIKAQIQNRLLVPEEPHSDLSWGNW